ncbi:MAG: Mini-ribonuclease 3 [Bacilli bacterium]|nr:Mini-ribonuclease 3 [Bacilli bacterium]
MNIDTINIIALAYLGDSIFDLYIRESLINKGIQKVELLQKVSTKYVSAKGQARILNNLIENDLLTEEELDVVKRGRNNKRSNHPKNTDIITYKLSTGFEALLGYLYLSNRQDRLKEILNYIEVK